jgi:lipoate---protein ligase
MWIDDRILLQCRSCVTVAAWAPQDILVVAGSSNDLQRECLAQNCTSDAVPMLKRSGGGGTVVLHPGCAVLSVGLWVRSHFRNDFFFKKLNEAMILALRHVSPKFSDLYQDGISDVVFAGKKVAGTSMFRSRNYLLYQASILVEDRLSLIERYLAHPSKEPDYRSGKSHRDFLTCLAQIDDGATLASVLHSLEQHYPSYVRESLHTELCEPQEEQIAHVLAKAKAGHPAADVG